MENKFNINSLNEENKIFHQFTIKQNNDIINNKTSREYSTSSIFRKKEKNKNGNLNIIPNSRAKKKKFLNKYLSSSFINNSNINNDTFVFKGMSNSSIGKSVNNFIFNINENTSNRENLNNFLNNVTSNKTINSEKIKIKKKLDEYRKLIDKKLNDLTHKRKHHPNTSANNIKAIKLKLFDKEGKYISNNNNCETNYEIIKRKIKCISSRSRSINTKI